MPGARASRPGLREAAYKPNAVPGRRALHGSEATPIRDLRDQFRSPALRAIGFKRSRMPGPALRAPGSGKQPTNQMQFSEGGRCMAARLHLSETSTTNFVVPCFPPLGSRDPGCPGPALRAPGSGKQPTNQMQFSEGGRCMAARLHLSETSTTNFVVPRFAGRCKRSRMPGARASLEGARDPG
jgi:hypothetical protein